MSFLPQPWKALKARQAAAQAQARQAQAQALRLIAAKKAAALNSQFLSNVMAFPSSGAGLGKVIQPQPGGNVISSIGSQTRPVRHVSGPKPLYPGTTVYNPQVIYHSYGTSQGYEDAPWASQILLMSLISDDELERKFRSFYEQLHSSDGGVVHLFRLTIPFITERARLNLAIQKWSPKAIYCIYEDFKFEQIVDLFLSIFTTRALTDVCWQPSKKEAQHDPLR